MHNLKNMIIHINLYDYLFFIWINYKTDVVWNIVRLGSLYSIRLQQKYIRISPIFPIYPHILNQCSRTEYRWMSNRKHMIYALHNCIGGPAIILINLMENIFFSYRRLSCFGLFLMFLWSVLDSLLNMPSTLARIYICNRLSWIWKLFGEQLIKKKTCAKYETNLI